MRRTAALLLAAASPLATGAAQADEPGSSTGYPEDPLERRPSRPAQADVVPNPAGLAIALRSGWAIPQGERESGSDLDDDVVGNVPVWLDLGYRLGNHLWLGVYAMYAFTFPTDCPASSICNASDVRFGLQVQWHFGERHGIDHWVGIGTGFEILEIETDEGFRRFGGYEFVNLQAGEDFSLGRRFALGPFTSVSIGKYTGIREGESGSDVIESDIAKRTFHVWVTIGLRLSFGA